MNTPKRPIPTKIHILKLNGVDVPAGDYGIINRLAGVICGFTFRDQCDEHTARKASTVEALKLLPVFKAWAKELKTGDY